MQLWPSPLPELCQNKGKLEPDKRLVKVVDGAVALVIFLAPVVCQVLVVLDFELPRCASHGEATLPKHGAAVVGDTCFGGASGQWDHGARAATGPKPRGMVSFANGC